MDSKSWHKSGWFAIIGVLLLVGLALAAGILLPRLLPPDASQAASPTLTPTSALSPQFPLQRAAGFTGISWSPDGRYFAFFTQTADELSQAGSTTAGTFTLYNLETGAFCQYAESNPHGLLFGAWHAWQTNGSLEVLTSNHQIAVLSDPCVVPAQPTTYALPSGAEQVLSSSADAKTLTVKGQNGCWLVPLNSGKAFVLPGCSEKPVFSLDGSLLAITIPGNSQNSRVTRVVDVPTGAITDNINWTTGITETESGQPPIVWMGPYQMILPNAIPAPLFVTLEKPPQVVPAVEHFGLHVGQARMIVNTADSQTPPHLLFVDTSHKVDGPIFWLFHPESGVLEQIGFDNVSFSSDGRSLDLLRIIHSGDYEQMERWQRAIDPPEGDAHLIGSEDVQNYPTLSPDRAWQAMAVQAGPDAPVMVVIQPQQTQEQAQTWQMEAYVYELTWSPDSRHLAAVGEDPKGRQSLLGVFTVP